MDTKFDKLDMNIQFRNWIRRTFNLAKLDFLDLEHYLPQLMEAYVSNMLDNEDIRLIDVPKTELARCLNFNKVEINKLNEILKNHVTDHAALIGDRIISKFKYWNKLYATQYYRNILYMSKYLSYCEKGCPFVSYFSRNMGFILPDLCVVCQDYSKPIIPLLNINKSLKRECSTYDQICNSVANNVSTVNGNKWLNFVEQGLLSIYSDISNVTKNCVMISDILSSSLQDFPSLVQEFKSKMSTVVSNTNNFISNLSVTGLVLKISDICLAIYDLIKSEGNMLVLRLTSLVSKIFDFIPKFDLNQSVEYILSLCGYDKGFVEQGLKNDSYILITISLISLLLTQKFPIKDSLQNFVMKWGLNLTGMAGIFKLFHFFTNKDRLSKYGEFIIDILGLSDDQIPTLNYIMSQEAEISLCVDYFEGLQDVVKLRQAIQQNELDLIRKRIRYLQDCQNKLLKWSKCLQDRQTVCVSLKDILIRAIKLGLDIQKKYIMEKAIVESAQACPWIDFSGSPGTMKTSLVQKLYRILEKEFDFDGLYVRDKTRHYDAHTNQNVFLFDDYNQQKDHEKLGEIFSLTSGKVFIPPKANAADKGDPVVPRLVLTTSNSFEVMEKNSCTSVEAFERRRTMLIKVRLDPNLCPKHSGKSSLKKMDCSTELCGYDKDFSKLQFAIVPSVGAMKMRIEFKWIKLNTLINLIIKHLKNHYKLQAELLNDELNYTFEDVDYVKCVSSSSFVAEEQEVMVPIETFVKMGNVQKQVQDVCDKRIKLYSHNVNKSNYTVPPDYDLVCIQEAKQTILSSYPYVYTHDYNKGKLIIYSRFELDTEVGPNYIISHLPNGIVVGNVHLEPADDVPSFKNKNGIFIGDFNRNMHDKATYASRGIDGFMAHGISVQNFRVLDKDNSDHNSISCDCSYFEEQGKLKDFTCRYMGVNYVKDDFALLDKEGLTESDDPNYIQQLKQFKDIIGDKFTKFFSNDYFKTLRDYWNNIINNTYLISGLGLLSVIGAYFYLHRSVFDPQGRFAYTEAEYVSSETYSFAKSFGEEKSTIEEDEDDIWFSPPPKKNIQTVQGKETVLNIMNNYANHVYPVRAKYTMNAINIRSTFFLFPRHFFRNIGETFEIYYKDDWRTIPFQLENYHEDSIQDIAIYYIKPGLFYPGKDIVSQFMTEMDVLKCKSDQFSMFVKRQNMTQLDFKGKQQLDFYYGADTTNVAHVGMIYHASTIAGDCGNVLFINNKSYNAAIYGMHVSGIESACKGFSIAVPREQLEKLLTKFENKFQPQGYELDNTINIIDDVTHISFPSGITTLGKVDKKFAVFSPSKTDLIPTIMFDKIMPHDKEPAVLFDKEKDPIINGIEKYSKKIIPFDFKDLNNYNVGYRQHLGTVLDRKLHVLSEYETIMGLNDDGLSRLNKNSSCGWHQTTMKHKRKEDLFDFELGTIKDDEFRTSINNIEMKLTKSQLPPMIYTDCLKDEKRPIEKVLQKKTRSFTISPIELTYLTRKYCGDYLKFLYDQRLNLNHAIGINIFGVEWTDLFNILNKHSKNIIAGDYSNFDGTECGDLMMEFAEDMNYCYNDVHSNIRRTLLLTCVHTLQIYKDSLYMTHQGVPSGTALTVYLNSENGKRYLACAYNYLARKFEIAKYGYKNFNKFVKYFVYGDDNIISVSEDIVGWFNMDNLVAFFRNHGITYTDEMKNSTKGFRSIFEVSFLKNKFIRHEYHSRIIKNRIDASVINGLLNWQRKNINKDEQFYTNLEDCIKFMYGWGEQKFNNFIEVVNQHLEYQDMKKINYSYHDYDSKFLLQFGLY